LTRAIPGYLESVASDATSSACIVGFVLASRDDGLDLGRYFPVEFGDNPDS